MSIFLPGQKRQYNFLLKNYTEKPLSILVIGSASEQIAVLLSTKFKVPVELIVEDYGSLMNSKLVLGGEDSITVRMMNFDATDFSTGQFDLVYAQASVSLSNRNKIVKEIKRILKPGGYFSVGETVALRKDYPPFIKDLFDGSNILPLFYEDTEKYYSERKFKVVAKADLTDTLADFYKESSQHLRNAESGLSDKEKSYYKKLVNRIGHESNAYLKLGGDKFIGFETLLLMKESA
ncbi:MAG: methyltransferase domain-containing protein [Ignavibacteria bacterium]|nr:methyltransferase domain-containing protein [Ignavibacteria bacterium]MDP3581703.1 methyltransferase domain-containing protein [Ignavibacteria bacterium]